MGTLGSPSTVQESQQLGRAAVMAMVTVARSAPGALLDSTFYPYTIPAFKQLPGLIIDYRWNEHHLQPLGPGPLPEVHTSEPRHICHVVSEIERLVEQCGVRFPLACARAGPRR